MFNDFTTIIITALAALVALTVHEFSHGYAAYKLGDNTARSLGRLTLNPLRHIDPFGALCMIFFHFGWAKPVPINARNFKNPKRDFAITAMAGPLSNVILGFISALLYLLSYRLLVAVATGMGEGFLYNFAYNLTLFCLYFHTLNVGLGIFNLIPIPPFDGSRILNVILPARIYFKVMRYERYIYWGVVAWLLLGGYVYSALMSIGFIAASPVLSTLARVFSLSGMISDATGALSRLMLKFWELIFPFI